MFRAIVVALLIAAVSADLAPLLSANSPTAIQGSYVVVLKDGLTLQQRDAHINQLRASILNDASSEVGFLYGMQTFVGFSARLSEKTLKEQLAHPNVKYIEADQTVSLELQAEAQADAATITQPGATWGLDRIDQASLPLDGTYVYNSLAGAGVDVYVIDTGVYAAHVDFQGRAMMSFNAVDTSPTDGNGHGTHCASTIAGVLWGVAKLAHIKGVKVLSAGGSGTLAGVIAGVDFVARNATRPSVASMSLGGGAMQALDDAVTALIATGVQTVIAAGNSNANACNYSPARTPNAVTVGATERTDARASYSNFGTCVDIFAPGSAITAAWIGGINATNTISGTSMATPHVAGVLAMRLSMAGQQTPAALKTWVNTVSTPDKVTAPGTGSPNRLLFSPTTA